MKPRALYTLVVLYARRNPRSLVYSALGIAVGIAFLTFFLSLAVGVDRKLIARAFPPGQMEIVPRRAAYDAGPLSLLAGPKPLDEAFVTQLRARPEVKIVFARMQMAFPARAEGGRPILPRDLHAELIAEGLDPAALEGDQTSPLPFARNVGSQTACSSDPDCQAPEYCPLDTGKCEPPVPVLLSPFVVELYNSAIAPTHGLPRLGKFVLDRFAGFSFTAELGRSMLGRSRTAAEPRARRFMLVGLSPRAAPLAVTVPLPYVVEWNALYAGADAAARPTSLLVELHPHANQARLDGFVRDAGFAVADSGKERVGLLLLVVTGLLALTALSVLVMATLSIAQTFFRSVAERRRDMAVMRAIGARASDLFWWLLCEAVAIGALGGAVGLVTARVMAALADLAAAKFLPEFPFRPDSYFEFPPLLLAGAIVCGIVAALLGALVPAWRARRLDPSAALQNP